jgi:4-aminobutyrate aminotransferase-like enzyme
VATSPAGALPAHVHVQLARDRLEEMPDDVPASLAAAWLHLCPDPALLLGFDAVQAREPDREGVLTRRLRFLGSPYGLYYPSDPPQIERGWKQWLYDVDGRCYLDVVNNIAAVGHSHPRVEAAATRQLRMLNTNSRFLYSAMGRLAERLVSLVPEPMDTVFLLSSGSEANDLALQLARRATGHRDVVCFEGAYHGWTAATNVLMTGSDVTGAVRPVHQLSKPEASAASDRVAGGTARFADQACDAIEAMAEQGRPPAAFLCEPLLGNSGGVLLPDGYLERVYRAVREAGGVCVADEVQVGYGRLGHHFWAFEQQNVVPDIVTIAKSAGNGYPVAAVITTRAIADQFHQPERSFFSSVAGSPVACEVAIAVLDVMEEEGLQHNATVVGDYLHACLEPMAAMHPMVGAALGMGLYRGIPLLRDGDPDRPATEEAGAICERMRDLGVIVQATGEGRNVLKVKPPLCITRHDIDFFISALERTLTGGW